MTLNFSYTYDPRDRKVSFTTPWGTLNYPSREKAKVDVITSTNGYNVNYNYYTNSGLLYERRDDKGTTTYTYDNTNNLDIMYLPNNTSIDYEYNSVNQMTGITVKVNNTTIQSFSYTLSPTGNKTSVTELTGRSVGWGYDDLYRLTAESVSGGTENGDLAYQYDDVGNREQRLGLLDGLNPQSFSYDVNDRIQGFTWNRNGCLSDDGMFTYTWNAKNELLRVQGTGVDVSYMYDGDGLRVSRTDNLTSVTTYYIWDTENPTGYPQVLEEVESGVVTKRYGYGHFLEYVDIYDGVSAYNRYYVIRDGQNSVRMLLDELGNVVQQYEYDAFGTLLTPSPSPLSPYLFHSEYMDPATNLVYLRARWYNPKTGRFLSMDEFEARNDDVQNKNTYTYALNNVINTYDPLGLYGIDMTAAGSLQGPLSVMPNVLWVQVASSGIYSKGHKVSKSKYRHASFRIYPTDQEKWAYKNPFVHYDAKRKKYFATIGAFTSSPVQTLKVRIGSHKPRMIAVINRDSDRNEIAIDFEKIYFGTIEKENATINSLLAYVKNFQNEYIVYTLFPEQGKKEYNSNSFHVSLAREANLLTPSFVTPENGYPGANNLLPSILFH